MTHSSPMRAFTLVETVIVIALTVCMMTIVGLLIHTFGKTSSYGQASSQSSLSAGALMRELATLVAPASAVLETHTFSTGTYTSSANVLVLEIPSIDSSGSTVANSYDYAAFYLVGTSAYRRLEANGASARPTQTKLLSTTVNALSFTFDDAMFANVSSVTVDVETEARVKQDTASDHRNEQFILRNH